MNILKKIYIKVKSNILWNLPYSLTHKYLYYKKFNLKLNLNNPKNLNEKIQYLIVKKYGEKEGLLADKYLVKEYVKKLKINELNIPKTLKVYSDANEIDISDLPDKFVLKCNHGCGNVFVCDDKKNFNIEEVKKLLNKNLKTSFAKCTYEYHYKFIKPLIIAEEYLNDGTGKNPLDFKFYVFNGKCDRILVCSERDKKLRLDDYDLEWNVLDDTLPVYKSKKAIDKPKKLDKMIKIAEDLCKKNGELNIPFARVDLYNLDGKIYFGEYTFTPACGLIYYYHEKTLKELGEKIDLTKYD